MRVVALVSGGKDSCFNIMQCLAAGHEIVALANLYPIGKDELDSYMFQTVGHQGVEFLGEAMGLPLYREPTLGKSSMKEKYYTPTLNDEVEDLFRLIKRVKDQENIQAVASGAIFSDYQRIRVENVCSRLGLVSLTYLWRQDQEQLLRDMIECSVNAVVIKVASLGLEPSHLGKSISEMLPHLVRMKEKYGLNVCGEGGEYETFTLDCPLYIKSIIIDEYESVVHSNDDVAPVGYLNFKKIHLQKKSANLENLTLKERLQNIKIKTPYDFIAEIVKPHLQDVCNFSDDENDVRYKEDRGRRDLNLNSSDSTSLIKKQFKSIEYSDIPNSNKNRLGWHWFGNIIGKNSEPKLAMAEALDNLIDLLKKENLDLQDIVSVTIFLKDLSIYVDMNEVYVSKLANVNPPVRVCTELPINFNVILDATAYKKIKEVKNNVEVYDRHTLHIQSISHWAPANIGPYSQAIRVGDIISVAGQIPLIPGNMTILDSDIRRQCSLTLRHIYRIVKAMDSNTELRHIVQGICFLTHPNSISAAREEWEKRTTNAIVDYVVVKNLPRNAQVEWCVWAHRDNNRFEYEETGKCIGNIKVAIRRRWNYENNVSAILCYLSMDSSNSGENKSDTISSAGVTLSELIESFEYLLRKLTKGSETLNPPCNLRIFHKINNHIDPNLIQQTLRHFSNRNLVTITVPTLHLHNYSTFISVCGVRHE